MSISDRIRTLARDATIGMTDKDVLEKTELSFATWRKFLDGIVPSEKTILQFCTGLGIDAQPFLDERARVTGKRVDRDRIIVAALELSELSQDSKRELMAEYRRLLELDRKHAEAAA